MFLGSVLVLVMKRFKILSYKMAIYISHQWPRLSVSIVQCGIENFGTIYAAHCVCVYSRVLALGMLYL